MNYSEIRQLKKEQEKLKPIIMHNARVEKQMKSIEYLKNLPEESYMPANIISPKILAIWGFGVNFETYIGISEVTQKGSVTYTVVMNNKDFLKEPATFRYTCEGVDSYNSVLKFANDMANKIVAIEQVYLNPPMEFISIEPITESHPYADVLEVIPPKDSK